MSMNLVVLSTVSFELLDVIIIRKLASKNNEHTCTNKHSKKMQLSILNSIQGSLPFQVLLKHLNIF